MSATVSAVIAQRPAQDGKPSITYRYAGDRAVLVEYGEMEFDLTLNFLVLAVDDALRSSAPEGLVETAPGFRSLRSWMSRPLRSIRRSLRNPAWSGTAASTW